MMLIVVTGLECVGKTTIATYLSEEYRLCLISRDDIKESLFESLGYGDRNKSRSLGAASYFVLKKMLKRLACKQVPMVVESNFSPLLDSEFFNEIEQSYGGASLQLVLKCERNALIKRFDLRASSSDRHEGHLDKVRRSEFIERIHLRSNVALSMSAKTVVIDTTSLTKSCELASEVVAAFHADFN